MTNSVKFKNPAYPIEERVEDLMARMTLREKLAILIETSPANERLGIPKYNHGNEALHGIVRPGTYTVFPQAIALGATFDDTLIEEIADAISDESRAVYHHGKGTHVTEEEYEGRYNGLLTFWSPDLNICRDPRWGRTGETYGEDPYLCGKMGAAFVRGLQGKDPRYLKAVSTPKHYTANNEEHNRFSCNAEMSEKTLREYHLEPFRRAVEEGHPAAVMAAYNAVNGEPCHQNHYLLTQILRDEWGFDGYVVSDCSGIARLWDQHRKYDDPADAASAALNAGVDLECGSYSPWEHFYVEFLEGQLAAGKTTEARIDEACRRVLTARFKLGQFDPEEEIPFRNIPLSVVGCEKHAALAYRAAAESIVLLKNNGILPLKPEMKVAVVGNNAHLCQFGDYSGRPKNTPISPLDGIQAEGGENITAVRFKGIRSADEYTVITSDYLRDPDGNPGLCGRYYNNGGLLGAHKARTDAAVDFAWRNQMPDTFIETNQYSISWEGTLCPDISGTYYLRLTYGGCAPCEIPKLTLAGEEIGTLAAIPLEAGKQYPITIEYIKTQENPEIHLSWIMPSVGEDVFGAECNAAREADVVVAVVGLGREYECEGRDKDSLDLPPEQIELLRRLWEVNRNLIVVLETGSPMTIPEFHEHSAAVIEAWYPGESGGRVLAEILYGKVNPSGRLCASFPMSQNDIPPFNDYEMSHGRTYMYNQNTPLYPFGFGLSYTTFAYSDLTADRNTVTVRVKNTGDRAGDEVVQLYLDSTGLDDQPMFRLVRFQRISLAAGEEQTVVFDLDDRCFTLFSDEGKEIFVSGTYNVYAGGSLPTERSLVLGAAPYVRNTLTI
ncbi:MAG: glycoside hydrolase family 3 C-terminal domain-containing protein [Clostridia bacterium]|nr:glycoside hydrolase family 3 C-terminal domain-containing protein [Clostridia bacterium]